MKPELEKELLTKYPKIFRQKDLPMNQTCMCWGISTGDGWFNLLDEACGKIQKYIDQSGASQVEAIQVKEKFGGLRFYTNHCDTVVDTIIATAEDKSYNTCEKCGSTEDVAQTTGWIATLCKNCIKK